MNRTTDNAMPSSSPNDLSKTRDCVFLVGIVLAMLAVGIVITLDIQAEGRGWLQSIFLGASAAVFIVWATLFFIFRIYMRIARGAPFRIGDRIEVTSGPLAGAVGKVRQLCEGRCSVFVALDGAPDSLDLQLFDWTEIRRLRKRSAE